MKNFILLLSFLFAMSINLQAFGQAPTSTVDTVKEVFLKGSIDGDHMFMVLGMQEGMKITKEIMKDAINGEDLLDLKDSVTALGESIKNMQDIAKVPWKSLKKIPKSYKVDFERAQTAYYGADTELAGVLKYSGWAVWANVKGAYYLVIETPVVAAYEIVKTGTATALRIAGLGIEVAWRLVRGPIEIIAGAAVFSYSAASSTIATTATLIAAGGVAIYKGGKWLIVTLPSEILKPLSSKIATDTDFTEQENLAKKIAEYANLHSDIFGKNALVLFDINKFKSEFEISLLDAKDKTFKAFSLRTFIQNKKVFLKLEATRDYLRAEKNETENDGLSRGELKNKIEMNLHSILETINTNV